MTNVVELKPCANAATALRNIADMIDRGELENKATVICGAEVFTVGVYHDEDKAQQAVWDMNYGIAKLMRAALDAGQD